MFLKKYLYILLSYLISCSILYNDHFSLYFKKLINVFLVNALFLEHLLETECGGFCLLKRSALKWIKRLMLSTILVVSDLISNTTFKIGPFKRIRAAPLIKMSIAYSGLPKVKIKTKIKIRRWIKGFSRAKFWFCSHQFTKISIFSIIGL